MTKNILTLLLISSFMLAMTACEKVENKVIYQGGTAPVLSTSATGTVVLIKEKNKENALTLAWTNPNYLFNTGVNSQNVNYVLQVDTAGKNFASPKLQEMTIASDLGVTLTGQQFNSFLSKMEFAAGVVQAVDLRVKATLANGSVPLTSNSINLKVNPYLDFAVEPPGTPANNYNDGQLWITGNSLASGFINPLLPPYDVTQKFTKIDNLHFEGVFNFIGGGGAKLIQTQGVWGTQYRALDGSASAALSGSFDKKDADPQFPGPPAGKYKMQVNFQTGKYILTKI
ncbi:MAG: SusE domain-containing protein [Sphingobacteriales bacterium]|nr:SusE domain-containing protein [Sphingobacteriales bacterium]